MYRAVTNLLLESPGRTKIWSFYSMDLIFGVVSNLKKKGGFSLWVDTVRKLTHAVMVSVLCLFRKTGATLKSRNDGNTSPWIFPSRIWTCNLPVTCPTLYRLSHRGSQEYAIPVMISTKHQHRSLHPIDCLGTIQWSFSCLLFVT